MKKLDQQGSAGLLMALVVAVVLLIGALIFAIVEYGQAQNYKTSTDAIVARQVKIAVDQNSTSKDNQFAEQLKSPLQTYNGPSAYGSIVIKYPKTWSAYVDTSSQANQPIDAYFNPGYVPGTDSGSPYAMRLQVTSDSFDDELQQFDGQAQDGSVRVTPFSFPSVKGVVGVKVTGKITDSNQGVLILVPLRDKALKLWTETDQNVNDFNKYVLPNFKFSP